MLFVKLPHCYILIKLSIFSPLTVSYITILRMHHLYNPVITGGGHGGGVR